MQSGQYRYLTASLYFGDCSEIGTNKLYISREFRLCENLFSFWNHFSVQNGSADVLEHILSHEACDVDPINHINRATPLHLACQLEDDGARSYMVESLLEAGADTKIRDKRGELAESFVPPTDEETRKLFRKARAQIMTVSKDDIASGELPGFFSK